MMILRGINEVHVTVWLLLVWCLWPRELLIILEYPSIHSVVETRWPDFEVLSSKQCCIEHKIMENEETALYLFTAYQRSVSCNPVNHGWSVAVYWIRAICCDLFLHWIWILYYLYLRIGTKIATLFSPFIVWKLWCVLHVCACDIMVFAAVIVTDLIVSCDIYVSECMAYRSMHVNKLC